jgi:hypothetical protein
MTNYDIEAELRPHLSSGERFLWTGKPKTGIVFRSSDIIMIPFSLFWAGFAVVWESMVIVMGAPFIFKIWGIPFVLVGLYITIGRFFADAVNRANTRYGLTQERIIIKSGIFKSEIKSLNIKSLSDITLNQKPDNSGTITLGPVNNRIVMMPGKEWNTATQPPCLEFIDDVREVYDKILRLQSQQSSVI